MSNVSAVTNHFPTANEGFITTLGSTILSGAATVPLTSVSGLTNGTVFVGIIEPGQANEQTFTGTVDTSGVQITGVKWTRGSNVDHTAGVTIVDYVSGTGNNMFTKGISVEHNQDGTHGTMTADNLTVDGTLTQTGVASFTTHIDVNDSSTAIRDSSDNELLKFAKTASAVNELTITNAATGAGPTLSATGGDTNIDANVATKGTGVFRVNGNPFDSGVATAHSATLTGFSGTPTQNNKYTRIGKWVALYIDIVGTSNATSFTLTLPFAAKAADRQGGFTVSDNGVAQTLPGLIVLGAASSTATVYKTHDTASTWTNVNSKAIRGMLLYEAN